MRKIKNTDEIDKEYSVAIGQVKTIEDLKRVMNDYGDLVLDAKKIVDAMSQEDFKKFLKNRDKERKGIFCGDIATATILLPKELLEISIIAMEFKVAAGMVYLRKKDCFDEQRS